MGGFFNIFFQNHVGLIIIFSVNGGIYINIERCGVHSSTLKLAPCWVDYQFSDTKIQLIIDTTKQKGGLFNII